MSTVLLVEDAELCSATLEIALQMIPGLEIRSASSGEEAIEFLAKQSVSAIVTDLHLPRMDGLELVARVRAIPESANLPIIVLTGDTDPRTPERAISAGANAFFVKPYSPAAVRRKLENLICDGECTRSSP